MCIVQKVCDILFTKWLIFRAKHTIYYSIKEAESTVFLSLAAFHKIPECVAIYHGINGVFYFLI